MRRIGVLGAGGLGRAAVRLLEQKNDFRLVALADTKGIIESPAGVTSAHLAGIAEDESIARAGRPCEDGVAEMIALNKAGRLDAIFLAVPNIPNDFVPTLVLRFCREGFDGVLVDALKRTSAVRQIIESEEQVANSRVLYVTGAGATPGLLTAAANLAAQSFAEIDEVKIWFGVGMTNWEKYKATVREDIAHVPGYSVEKVRTLTDAEVDAILDGCNGVLEMHGMEHADDIILERAGVVEAKKVSVGGLVDTRNAKKPTSTTMVVRGKTFEGKTSEHRFVLGDDTSMAANVLGPAFGWMNAALELHDRGIHGLFTSADLAPRFVR